MQKTKKSLIYVKILILTLILFVLIFIIVNNKSIFGGSFMNNIFSKNNVELEEFFSKEFDINHNIDVVVSKTSADIEIYKTESDKIKIVFLTNNSENLEILEKVENNSINFNASRKKINFVFFNINIKYDVLQIYLPKEYFKNISCEASSGGIILNDDFKLDNLSLFSISGDIKMQKLDIFNNLFLETASGSIKTDSNLIVKYMNTSTISGDISMNDLDFNNKIEMRTTSGNINAKNVVVKTQNENGNETSIFSSVSGDIKIEKIIGNIETNSTSGSLKINEFSYHGKFSTISGDIDLNTKLIDGDLTISSVSGSIKLKTNSNENVNFSTTSGSFKTSENYIKNGNNKWDIENNGNYTINAKTVSGDFKYN